MKGLDLQQERFSPTGNIASEGMRNQLGRPKLDRLAVLVREAAQNSWDAKAEDFAAVAFGLSSYSLTKEQFDVLSKVVFHRRPPPEAVVGDDSRSDLPSPGCASLARIRSWLLTSTPRLPLY